MHEFRNVLLLSPARAAKPVNNIRRRRQIFLMKKLTILDGYLAQKFV